MKTAGSAAGPLGGDPREYDARAERQSLDLAIEKRVNPSISLSLARISKLKTQPKKNA